MPGLRSLQAADSLSTMAKLITLRPMLLLCAVSWIWTFFTNTPDITDKLCDYSAGYGTLQCCPGRGSCPGAAEGGSCFPQDMWSGTKATETEYHDFALRGGSLNPLLRVPAYAYTVRCVLDLQYVEFP